MGIVSRQIGWSTQSNLLWIVLQQVIKLTKTIYALKPNYTTYRGLVSQVNTDNPTDIPLENTISDIVWTYEGIGQISITSLTNAFTVNKTYAPPGTFFDTNTSVVYSYSVASMNANKIVYNIVDIYSTPTDNVLSNIPFEIIVYK